MIEKSLVLSLREMSIVSLEDISNLSISVEMCIGLSVCDTYTNLLGSTPDVYIRGRPVTGSYESDLLFAGNLTQRQLDEIATMRHAVYQLIDSSITSLAMSDNEGVLALNIDYAIINRNSLVISCSIVKN